MLLANITVWGPAVNKFLAEQAKQDFSGGCLPEVHLPAEAIEGQKAFLNANGWRGDFAPSQPTPSPHRAPVPLVGFAARQALSAAATRSRLASGEGGSLTFCRSFMAASDLPVLTDARKQGQAKDVSAQLLHLRGGNLAAICDYQRPSVGPGATVNRERLRFLAALVALLDDAWFIFADWNCTPEVLEATGWVELVKGTIWQPTDISFTSRSGQRLMYDYIVASAGANLALKSLTWYPTVPWRDHRALRQEINTTVRTLVGPQLALPAPFPAWQESRKLPSPHSKASRQRAARLQARAEKASPVYHGELKTENKNLGVEEDPVATPYSENKKRSWRGYTRARLQLLSTCRPCAA